MHDDSKVKRYVCTRVLLEDGETFKPTHFRVVALGDYDDAMMRIGELEAAILVHRQQEPNCRCGFELVLPSKAIQAGGGADGG